MIPVAISTADFRNGMCIEYKDKLWVIIEFQHVKPGKGGAFVRTKLRDIRSGRVVDYTFNSGTKFETLRLEKKVMQYLYNDGVDYHFMDPNTYDQIALNAEVVGDTSQWLKENDEVTLLYAGDELIGLEPQMFVELEVTDTEPGFKGDTVQGGTKTRNARNRRDHPGSHVHRQWRYPAYRYARWPLCYSRLISVSITKIPLIARRVRRLVSYNGRSLSCNPTVRVLFDKEVRVTWQNFNLWTQRSATDSRVFGQHVCRIGDMPPILPKMHRVGYWAIEAWAVQHSTPAYAF